MPILSARLITKPRRQRICDWCGRLIQPPVLRLYGMAEIGEKPGTMHLHRECTADPEVERKLKGGTR